MYIYEGNDPATDLRGCGILSLVLIIFMLDQEYYDITYKIYALSKHSSQHFPFSIVAINLVSLLVKLLRKNTLNAQFNKLPAISSLANSSNINNHENICYEFFSLCGKFLLAMYFDLYLEWKIHDRTINDFGFVLHELELKATGTPKALLKQLDFHLFRVKVDKRIEKSASSSNFTDLTANLKSSTGTGVNSAQKSKKSSSTKKTITNHKSKKQKDYVF